MRQLTVTSKVLSEMLDHGDNFPNQEICGMLLGKKENLTRWKATEYVEIENVDLATNYMHYKMHPNQMLQTLLRTTHANDDADMDFVGIFHTHPNNKAKPSSKDINRAGYCVFYPIYSPKFQEISLHFCAKAGDPWIKSNLNIENIDE